MAKDLLDVLYSAPLKDFVRTRDRLAAELLQAGKKDEAKRVRARKKPSAAVWAINAALRANPGKAQSLAAVAEKHRDVQMRALQGDSDAREHLRDAASAHAKVVSEIARTAMDKIAHHDATMHRKISSTLQALSLGDEAAKAALKAGTVETEAELDAFAELTLGQGVSNVTHAPAKPVKSAPRQSAADQAKQVAEEKRAAAAEARLQRVAEKKQLAERQRLSKTLNQKQDVLRRAVAQVARLEEKLAEAVRERDEAEAEVKRASQALAKLR